MFKTSVIVIPLMAPALRHVNFFTFTCKFHNPTMPTRINSLCRDPENLKFHNVTATLCSLTMEWNAILSEVKQPCTGIVCSRFQCQVMKSVSVNTAHLITARILESSSSCQIIMQYMCLQPFWKTVENARSTTAW